MRILIVDDDKNSRMISKSILEADGHRIQVAANGKEALDKACAYPPEIFISDILMPEMDGYQLCMAVKREERLKEIPFVFYSATYTDKQDEELALKIGADQFIRKPAEPDHFLKAIQGLIMEMKISRPKVQPVKEKTVLKLYNERLVNKLEKKMLRLEKEIAKRRQTERLIQDSLRDKEVLLGEIHHRVKNNLQVISSLLDLSSMRTRDEETISVLTDARSKIQTMALIHSQIYQSKTFDKIKIEPHIRELVSYLSAIYAQKKTITPVIEISDVYLSINQAIPFALVCNELISNAYKHAFRQDKEGAIEIFIQESLTDPDMIYARIQDNGSSISTKIDPYKANTLGLKLVRNLVRQQLKGKIHFNRNKGTQCIIEFKIIKDWANHV